MTDSYRDRALADVVAERQRQEQVIGYSTDHDDRLSPADWIVILVRHLGMGCFDGSPDGSCSLSSDEPLASHDQERWRRQLVRVAAIAVAAVESQDRKHQQVPAEVDDPLMAMAQRISLLEREDVLVMDEHLSPVNQSRRSACCILWSQSTPEERKAARAVVKYQPPSREVQGG